MFYPEAGLFSEGWEGCRFRPRMGIWGKDRILTKVWLRSILSPSISRDKTVQLINYEGKNRNLEGPYLALCLVSKGGFSKSYLSHIVTEPKWVPSWWVKSDSLPEVVVSQSKVYLQQIGGHEESFPESWLPKQREAGTFNSDGEQIFKRERWVFACTGSVGKQASTYTSGMVIRPKLPLERC